MKSEKQIKKRLKEYEKIIENYRNDPKIDGRCKDWQRTIEVVAILKWVLRDES